MKATLPFVSIIIPTYNRPRQLGQCLRSIAHLDYPKESFEVVIVDDGSEHSLASRVDPWRPQMDVTLCTQANAGPAAARNVGAEKARGDYLAFTDDDCSPTPTWLHDLVRHAREVPDGLVGGRTVNQLTGNIYATTSQLIVDMVYLHQNRQPCQARFFASNNIIVPAAAFRRVRGFDPDFRTSEDREFCDRWRHSGNRMIYAQDAVILHAHALTLKSFCKQHFAYGKGAYRYHKIRSQRGSGTLRGEMTFHLNIRNWLLYPFRQAGLKKSIQLSGILLLWQAINAIGYFSEMAAHKLARSEKDSLPPKA